LLKRQFAAIIFLFFCFGMSRAWAIVETKSSPNYLIILVHGVNTPGWVWRGDGEKGSDVRNLDGKYRGKGDILGYLRNDLGLDGYVYYYTF
jgi:hypothetical protein